MSNIKLAIIGGSGLDDPRILKDAEEKTVATPYGKTSSSLTCGKINGVETVILARHGKAHTIPPTQVPFRANLWALKELDCTHLIATTACGSLKEEIRPRDFVFLDQFIDMTKHRNLTFFEDFEEKIVHTPMAEPFCPQLRQALIETARQLGLTHHQSGTVVTIEGPRFSTKAESNFFRLIGGDVINMSTVPEVILARELGLCYASVAMATDYDCWRTGEEAVTWEMISRIMKDNAENVKKLLLAVVGKISWDKCEHCGVTPAEAG
ncbi:MAG: S-methyl-5'-thioadenosine phosphorylase [bacterium]|nr:S-methyl-5'-thioadenosine phosphorylase [bacterium]